MRGGGGGEIGLRAATSKSFVVNDEETQNMHAHVNCHNFVTGTFDKTFNNIRIILPFLS